MFVKHCICVHGHAQGFVYNMSSSGSDRKERAHICGNSCVCQFHRIHGQLAAIPWLGIAEFFHSLVLAHSSFHSSVLTAFVDLNLCSKVHPCSRMPVRRGMHPAKESSVGQSLTLGGHGLPVLACGYCSGILRIRGQVSIHSETHHTIIGTTRCRRSAASRCCQKLRDSKRRPI